MSEQQKIHVFEKAGLGKAPFQFTHVTEKVYIPGKGSLLPGPAMPAGKCDFCGACIRYQYHIKSSDNKEFIVGCDCVLKTEDKILTKEVKKARKHMEAQKLIAKNKLKMQERQKLWDAPKMEALDKGVFYTGKYKDMLIADIAKTDLQYVKWFAENPYGSQELRQRVEEVFRPIIDAQQKIVDANPVPASEYYGEIGMKLPKLPVEVLSVVGISGVYGMTNIITFQNGHNVYVAYYTGSDTFSRGDKVTIKATIKAHKEYKGIKQTIITRIKKI